MARIVDPVENSPDFQEAQQRLFSAAHSAGDTSDNIDERELMVVIGLGILSAAIEIARQLNRIAILTEDNTQ